VARRLSRAVTLCAKYTARIHPPAITGAQGIHREPACPGRG
jgi:hypothetical protein